MEEINVIRVIGLVSASEFQRAKFIARHLSNYLQDKSPLVEIKEMFQLDWLEYLEKERRVCICKETINTLMQLQ